MNWVELTRVNELVEAYALRTYLEAYEIDVMIPNEHSMRNMHHMTPAMGGYTMLKVPQAQLEGAREVLRQYNLNSVNPAPSDDEHLPEELRGNHDDIRRDDLAKRALRYAIFGALVFPVVMNIFSIQLLRQIYNDPRLLKDSKKTDLQIAMVFNFIGLVFWATFAYSFILDRP